uniref:Autophagy protein 5 n=1 Tax=Schistosoma mansoni TaxID=6183 RepID=A0A3Q0KMH8_SCHMA
MVEDKQQYNTNIDEHEDEEKILTDMHKTFHQTEINPGWFPKDLYEFFKVYNIDNFPVINLKYKLPNEDNSSMSLDDIHDLFKSEIDSKHVNDIIETMEKHLNDGYKQIIDEVNSLNIVSMIDEH